MARFDKNRKHVALNPEPQTQNPKPRTLMLHTTSFPGLEFPGLKDANPETIGLYRPQEVEVDLPRYHLDVQDDVVRSLMIGITGLSILDGGCKFLHYFPSP